jgi:DNA-binding transcriptional LysR family regulator
MATEPMGPASGSGTDPWYGVELRHLAALGAVAREGSFRAAAESLGYVQSAVSQQIAYLERRVGARLLERTRGARGTRPTAAGQILLRHLDEIVAKMRAAQADMASFRNGASEALRLGFHEQLGPRLLAAVLRELAKRSPSVEIVPTETSGDTELFGLVDRGAIDLAFADLPLEPGPFESCELLTEPCCLVVPATCELAHSDELPTAEQIAELRLIRHSRWRLMPAIEEQLMLHGVELDIRLASASSATLQGLVGAGLGAAILPRLAVNPSDLTTEALDLDGLVPPRRLVLCWHRERRHRPPVAAFCEAAKAACEGHGAEVRP